jgi:hypothetical protein
VRGGPDLVEQDVEVIIKKDFDGNIRVTVGGHELRNVSRLDDLVTIHIKDGSQIDLRTQNDARSFFACRVSPHKARMIISADKEAGEEAQR